MADPNRPTGEQVWEAMCQDPAFQAEVPPGKPRELFRELGMRLPEILAEHLDKPLTLRSLIEAKLAVAKDVADGDFMERLIAAYPVQMFQGQDMQGLVAMAKTVLSQALTSMDGVLADFDVFIRRQNASEEQLLAHPKGGKLGPAAMAEYRAGTLTVGRLLALQPQVIVKNVD